MEEPEDPDDVLTPEQEAELVESIREADLGMVVSLEEVMLRLRPPDVTR
jgi:hypothetical protein